jgi:hypothetical protein
MHGNPVAKSDFGLDVLSSAGCKDLEPSQPKQLSAKFWACYTAMGSASWVAWLGVDQLFAGIQENQENLDSSGHSTNAFC